MTIDFDDNLNTAGWEMYELLSKYGPVTGGQFNNMKGCLKTVIESYLERAELERTVGASAQKVRHLSDDTTDTDRHRPA